MYTVGELREYIKDLPDDTRLVTYHQGMEQSGYMNKAFVHVENMKSCIKETWDAFDGTPYSYLALVSAKDGNIPCLTITA